MLGIRRAHACAHLDHVESPRKIIAHSFLPSSINDISINNRPLSSLTRMCCVFRVDESLLSLYPWHSQSSSRVCSSLPDLVQRHQPQRIEVDVLHDGEWKSSPLTGCSALSSIIDRKYQGDSRTRGANSPSRACNHAHLVQRSEYARSLRFSFFCRRWLCSFFLSFFACCWLCFVFRFFACCWLCFFPLI